MTPMAKAITGPICLKQRVLSIVKGASRERNFLAEPLDLRRLRN